MPANYKPKSETEKALMDSLKQLELQCKERVDLLQALQDSRKEAEEKAANESTESLRGGGDASTSISESWLGDGTIPPIDYPDLARPPPLPTRPPMPITKSSAGEIPRAQSAPQYEIAQEIGPLNPVVSIPSRTSRTPSPEKKGGMLKTLRPPNKGRTGSSSSKMNVTMRSRPPQASAKAANLAFSATPRQDSIETPPTVADAAARSSLLLTPSMNTSRVSISETTPIRDSALADRRDSLGKRRSERRDFRRSEEIDRSTVDHRGRQLQPSLSSPEDSKRPSRSEENLLKKSKSSTLKTLTKSPPERKAYVPLPPPKLDHAAPGVLSYRKEYPDSPINTSNAIETARRRHGRPLSRQNSASESPAQSSAIRRKPLNTANLSRAESTEDQSSSSIEVPKFITPSSKSRGKTRARASSDEISPTSTTSEPTEDEDSPSSRTSHSNRDWEKKKAHVLKHLPPGIDASAAKSILNEVVIHGDEVHWSDIAGLEPAKSTLKETVVYPFLRPDLFSGLREPARGLLLFGPPGTGKTMLARAVATESKSTFFSIAAGSLVSKFLGESEKLVRALFALARVLAPSIIFVDEIDSLLGSRGGEGEHEATRRVKTEFLIQWSELQRAAAGREDKGKGDATTVLVLAATNLPWAIDEAARRRFVRRQYIPLPEDHVRKMQLESLLSHQKHELDEMDIEKLVILTDGMIPCCRKASRVS